MLIVSESAYEFSAQNRTQAATGGINSGQVRSYETTDKTATMQAVITALLDLGFIIDSASIESGAVNANKIISFPLSFEVEVRPDGDALLEVRAAARYKAIPVSKPDPYRIFFLTLDGVLGLTGQ